MEKINVFLDANIIIDLMVPLRPQHEAASALLKYLINNNYQIVISEDMLSTVFYVVKEKKQVLNFFKTIQSKWYIVPFGAEVIQNAIDLSLEKSLDLEDVLQCLCAKENGCSALITNDKKFVDCGVAIYTVDEFLAEKIKEYGGMPFDIKIPSKQLLDAMKEVEENKGTFHDTIEDLVKDLKSS